MAVVVTVAKGYDLDYVWRGQGAEPEKSAGGYYINAAQAGEPEGRWFGPGAEALGLAEGQVVEREPYDAVYQQVHPVTGEKLGRAPIRAAQYELHLAGLLGAEPHATAGRRLELQREARRLTRQSAPYTDATVSYSKSISVLHASIRENARRARVAADEAAAAYWDGRELAFQRVEQEANLAALRHLQEWAGVTRTGYHGSKVNGQETGKFERAHVIVSSWLQGTSRDGDPQDHVHNQVARIVQTESDDKWRALDTVSLRGQIPALQAIAAAHVECGLAREFGVAWVARADGRGNEIRGVTQAQMDAYSSRTESIKEATPAAVASWTAKYGRAPNSRELLHIQQLVTMDTRAGKEDAAIDWDEYARKWDATLGGNLAQVAGDVSNLGGPGTTPAEPRGGPDPQPSPEAQAIAARKALAAVQASQSTWTKADLLKHIGLALPAESRQMDAGAAVALLYSLADRAVAGEFEQVQTLEAPEWPAVPDYLRRDLDGRSVYTRPGTQRYATRVQLSLEERLIAQARREGAPSLSREAAARELGADAGALDAQLVARAQEGRASEYTQSGLRTDQAAALAHMLTSPRTAEVLVGPAGSGKTRTLAEAARAWPGQVFGTATSQAARNVLAGAGVQLAENSSVFLGHMPGERGARGIRRQLPAGSLIIIDEASMMSVADLADLLEYAAAHGHKVLIAGDQEQLTAVEGGGAMMLLARELGHVQLAEAVRFKAGWEQRASLRLRAGDVSALDIYDDHGRIVGGDPDDVMDAARLRYVAHYLRGTDVELIAMERDRCRELSRRVREDLIHLGKVDASREISLADGARAGVGDLLICRKNDHDQGTGEDGRTLANSDVVRVEEIGEDGTITVRLAVDRDPETGGRRFAAGTFTWTEEGNGPWPGGYAMADLAYASTGHAAQGRTVTIGLPVITGTETKQWFYSAMTRGAVANIAHVCTRPVKLAEAQPGTRPAPELARHERLLRERAGLPARREADAREPELREAHAVLADVLGRDGAEISATETWQRSLADADHLAVLNAQWQGETAGLHATRYREIIRQALPAEHQGDALDSGQATWLWRTMRQAEAAGLDLPGLAHRVIDGRSLTGARDLAAVIDGRIRKEAGPMVPAGLPSWGEQVPVVASADKQRYLRDLATAMDERKERLGDFAAEHQPGWALSALGPVPDEPLDRLEWQHRASQIAAYRELYDWTHETEPCGPEPAGDSPEKRAAWHAAFGAMNGTGADDMRQHPDGTLWLMRDAYKAETEWAPQHVGAELRQVRMAAELSEVTQARARAEATAARERGDADAEGRHETLAASAAAAAAFYREREELDAAVQADRDEWDRATEGSRHVSVAADSELRRRNPGVVIEPLRSAEPEAAPDDLPEIDTEASAARAARAAEQRAEFRARMEARQNVMVPAEDPDYEPEGEAWPAWHGRDREAVLQPPKPELRPSPRVAERVAEAEAGV